MAARASHEVLYRPYSDVLIIAPDRNRSAEMLRKCKRLVRFAGMEAINDAITYMELANGSRILALPGSERAVRGYTAPSLLIVDEAGWCHDDLYDAISPLLAASDGQLIALSTPNGRRGWFYHERKSGGDDFKRIEVP